MANAGSSTASSAADTIAGSTRSNDDTTPLSKHFTKLHKAAGGIAVAYTALTRHGCLMVVENYCCSYKRDYGIAYTAPTRHGCLMIVENSYSASKNGLQLHHAELNDKDISLVEELFTNNKIQAWFGCSDKCGCKDCQNIHVTKLEYLAEKRARKAKAEAVHNEKCETGLTEIDFFQNSHRNLTSSNYLEEDSEVGIPHFLCVRGSLGFLIRTLYSLKNCRETFLRFCKLVIYLNTMARVVIVVWLFSVSKEACACAWLVEYSAAPPVIQWILEVALVLDDQMWINVDI